MNEAEQINDGSKVAFKAGIWYVLSTIMVRMVTLITTPIFTRILSTDEYGTVQTFSSWFSLFFVIYGLNLTVSIGRAKIDYPDHLDDYIGSLQLLSLFVSLGLSVVVCIFLKPFSRFFELSTVGTMLLLLYLIPSPAIHFHQSGYRYKYKYKQNIALAWYTTVSTVALSLVLIFTMDGDKAQLRMAGIVIPTIAASLYFWIKSFINGHLKINTEYWKYGLTISLPMIPHGISLYILAQSDRIVISKFFGPTPVAYYSLVMNYAMLLIVLTEAMNQAWLPWFHDNYHLENMDKVRTNTKRMVVLVCYVGLACIALGPEAIHVLGGARYAQAVSCLTPMVLGVVCQCIYTHYINVELHWKKTKYASQGTMVAAVLNIILNLIFVPRFGYQAAAYTTFASYFVLLGLHCYITRRKLGVFIYDDKFMFLSMIVASAVAAVISLTYGHTMIRYGLLMIGFLSFLWVFREVIFGYLRRQKDRRGRNG